MLKIWIDDINDAEMVSESLKQEVEFILDDKRDIGVGDELSINLYYAKIGEYYIFDNDYVNELIDEATGYRTVLTDIGLTKDASKALHIEDWEIEHLRQGLKGTIEMLKIEKENE